MTQKTYLSLEALEQGAIFTGPHPSQPEETVYVRMVDGEVVYGFAPSYTELKASRKFFVSKNFTEYKERVVLSDLGKELVRNSKVLVEVTQEECEEFMKAIETSLPQYRWRDGEKPTGNIVSGHIHFNYRSYEEDCISYWSEPGFAKGTPVIKYSELRDALVSKIDVE